MILVIGSINLDFVTSAPRLPKPGETVSGIRFSTFPGGKGANQALACRRAGADVMLVGCVGKDANGDAAVKNLRESGVDLSFLRSTDLDTGVASIVVGENGDNMIVSVPGANAQLDKALVDTAFGRLTTKDFVLLQLEVPVDIVRGALYEGKRAGVRSILNLSPVTEDSPELATLADYVIMNMMEMRALSLASERYAGELKGLIQISSSTGQIFVITAGEEGAIVVEPGKVHRASAPRIVPVDTIGAGDTFAGYFAAGLDAGSELESALRRALSAGSLACLRPGAQEAIPSVEEVLRQTAD